MTTVETIRRRFLVLLALRWFQTGLQVPVLILLLQARGLDLTTISVVFATYSLTTAAFELPTGGLADVVGRRPVLIAAALLFVVESVGFGLGQDVVVLVAAAALGGLGRALDSGPLEAWFVDTIHAATPQADLKADLSRGKAIEAAALGLGALAGGGLVAVVPVADGGSALLDLSVPFLVSAALCVVMAAAIIGWVREPWRGPRRPVRGVVRGVPATIGTGLRLAGRAGALRRVTILMVGMGVALAAVEVLAPVAFADLLGGEARAAGPYAVLLTLGFFGSAAGSFLAPMAARLLRSAPRGILAARLLAAAAVLALAASSFTLVAVALVAFYALNGIARPLISDILHRSVSSAQRATILSVQSLTIQLCGVVAVLAIGPLAQHVSLLAAFALAAGVLALGAAACVRMPEPVRTPLTEH
ncbi:MAG: MFS transporter [Jiangellaceae bacterium]